MGQSGKITVARMVQAGENYFRYFEGGRPFFTNFFEDCAKGQLPRYSFVEPHFINFFEDVMWHDDVHPSSFDSTIYSDGGQEAFCSAIGSSGKSIGRFATRSQPPATIGRTLY
jgi:hypothetical protein